MKKYEFRVVVSKKLNINFKQLYDTISHHSNGVDKALEFESNPRYWFTTAFGINLADYKTGNVEVYNNLIFEQIGMDFRDWIKDNIK